MDHQQLGAPAGYSVGTSLGRGAAGARDGKGDENARDGWRCKSRHDCWRRTASRQLTAYLQLLTAGAGPHDSSSTVQQIGAALGPETKAAL